MEMDAKQPEKLEKLENSKSDLVRGDAPLGRRLINDEVGVKTRTEEIKSNGPQQSQYFQAQLRNHRFVEASDGVQVIQAEQQRKMKDNIQTLGDQMNHVNVQIRELAKTYEYKLSRLSQSVRSHEEGLSYLKQEMARQYAEIRGKLSERKISEAKTSDLVERQNMIVAQFEGRLAQMKKAMDEKEMAFMRIKSELEEAHRELLRIKRL